MNDRSYIWIQLSIQSENTSANRCVAFDSMGNVAAQDVKKYRA